MADKRKGKTKNKASFLVKTAIVGYDPASIQNERFCLMPLKKDKDEQQISPEHLIAIHLDGMIGQKR